MQAKPQADLQAMVDAATKVRLAAQASPLVCYLLRRAVFALPWAVHPGSEN